MNTKTHRPICNRSVTFTATGFLLEAPWEAPFTDRCEGPKNPVKIGARFLRCHHVVMRMHLSQWVIRICGCLCKGGWGGGAHISKHALSREERHKESLG